MSKAIIIDLIQHWVAVGSTRAYELMRNVECQTMSKRSFSLCIPTQTLIRTEKSPNKSPINKTPGHITVCGTQHGRKNHTKCNGDWNYPSNVRAYVTSVYLCITLTKISVLQPHD